jgi:hypothetical protein
MNYFLTALLLLPGYASSAQHIEIGAGVGTSIWLMKSSGNRYSEYNESLDKALVLRYATNGKLSYEAAVCHSSFVDQKSEYNTFIFDGPGDVIVKENYSAFMYSVAFKADYFLNKHRTTRLKHYVGLQLKPALLHSVYRENYYSLPSGVLAFSLGGTSNTFLFSMGFQYAVQYNICKFLALRLTTGIQIEPQVAFKHSTNSSIRPENPYMNASSDLGVMYRLH